MSWRYLGIAMIVPTLTVSILISWRTRDLKSELAHNLAVTFWIMANALWMISEFFGFDSMHIWGRFDGKHLALLPFSMGVLILAWYYLFQKSREERDTQMATL